MKEIRLHGIGGLGTVRAGEILVHAAVKNNEYGNSIPFFGFERQGAPVTSYVRLDKKPIRPKNQVYNPDCLLVLDPTVMNSTNVFEGIKDNSTLILNTEVEDIEKLNLPEEITTVAIIKATALAEKVLGNKITNTIILASFAKATNWVDKEILRDVIVDMFGEKNGEAFDRAWEETKIFKLEIWRE